MNGVDQELFQSIDGRICLLNPADQEFYPISDERENFSAAFENAEISSQEKLFRQAFEERRMAQEAEQKMPIPGGVGYGAFFSDKYKVYFTAGTIISTDIICPQTAGGNVTDYLYLTETNRSGKGVEALVCYLCREKLRFMIYDWSYTEAEGRWRMTLDAAKLKRFITTKSIKGREQQIISLQNYTCVNASSDKWYNQVFLFDYEKKSYVLVYGHSYQATLAEQREVWTGSWGPIIETFQDSYVNTNPLGFSNIYMRESIVPGKWTDYHLLKDDISTIRNDEKGFQIDYVLPNYSFLVH